LTVGWKLPSGRFVSQNSAAFGEVMEDASKGSGLIWEFGRTLVKQPARG
jgi:ornithine--oxo-acid transaminase